MELILRWGSVQGVQSTVNRLRQYIRGIKPLSLGITKRKLPGERISDFNITYDMPLKILFLVTSILEWPKIALYAKDVYKFVL